MEKIIFITGASSGIGEACARLFAKNNYKLILNARRLERLEVLKSDLEKNYGSEVLLLPFDVRERDAVKTAIESIPDEWKKIDILVNNAGLAMGLAPIESGNMDHWDTMIDTNIKGLLYVTRNVVPLMIANKTGHIVNIGSIAGKEIYSMGNVYCSTKHAVDALNRSMRLDLVKYPIKVSAVNPGAVETEFSLVRFEGDSERAEKVYEGFENLVADDIADAINWIVTRPAHVNINDLIIMPVAQPMAGMIIR
ncbi:MAG: SDR family oxidoreductase [Bacteroidia bacterium]|nr:SDR family oxidoreductase [Bacteroidia bacterium]